MAKWNKVFALSMFLVASAWGQSAAPIFTVDLPGQTTMEMVWIEPGTFTMGTTGEQKQWLDDRGGWIPMIFGNELPAHSVTITKGFYLGKYEVTQAQWEAVMGSRPWAGQPTISREEWDLWIWNPSLPTQPVVQEDPNHPAVCISWDEVQTFVHRLNEAAGDSLYRVPTEAEWEYACRAGTTALWSFGASDEPMMEYAWYGANSWQAGGSYSLHPVGTKLPNPWGIHDMYGNAWEWCQDWVGSYPSEAQVDPTGSRSGAGRVVRGGAFFYEVPLVRSAMRMGWSAKGSTAAIGARLVRTGPRVSTAITPKGWGQMKKEAR